MLFNSKYLPSIRPTVFKRGSIIMVIANRGKKPCLRHVNCLGFIARYAL